MNIDPNDVEFIVHPQILDDVERKYLSAVIRPFRNRMQSISKERNGSCEWLHFTLSNDSVDLPYFKPCKMYKGMTPGRKYSLDELGL